jgi:syntaxin-binding protein 1
MLHKNKSNVINPQAEDIEVIILDRSLDPITPLLHNLRYESMLFDLLQLQLEYYE